MEFKGINLDWDVLEIINSKGNYFKVFGGNWNICTITTKDYQKAKANAELISFAPEMLEMLIKTKELLLKDSWSIEQIKLRGEIEKLIKKATTI